MRGTLSPNADLVVRDTHTIKGRGVFAARAYRAGEIVETSPMMELPGSWDALPSSMQRVVYAWGYLCGHDRPHMHGVALGAGSLFNHEDDPNLGYVADVARKAMVYTARRDIPADAELTIDYNADIDPEEAKAMGAADWFAMVGITQLP